MRVCTACADSFACTLDESCWCKTLPYISEVRRNSHCICQACTAEQIKAYLESYPEKAAKFRDKKLSSEVPIENNYTENVDYYINESGHWVFTSYYLLKRGFCCQNQCKHCPYGYKKFN